jgi:hypothetical protein
MDSKMQTDMIVLDFVKAFDKVSHPRLLHKLRHYGIKGKNNQWITAFLESSTQAVVLENKVLHDLLLLKPCWNLVNTLLFSKCFNYIGDNYMFHQLAEDASK